MTTPDERECARVDIPKGLFKCGCCGPKPGKLKRLLRKRIRTRMKRRFQRALRIELEERD